MPVDRSCLLQPIADGKRYRVAFPPPQGWRRDRSINGRGVGGVPGVIYRNLLDNQVEGVPGKYWGTCSVLGCECRPSPQVQAGDYSAGEQSPNKPSTRDPARIVAATSTESEPEPIGVSFR